MCLYSCLFFMVVYSCHYCCLFFMVVYSCHICLVLQILQFSAVAASNFQSDLNRRGSAFGHWRLCGRFGDMGSREHEETNLESMPRMLLLLNHTDIFDHLLHSRCERSRPHCQRHRWLWRQITKQSRVK